MSSITKLTKSEPLVITLDGPSASGKGSVAKLLAEKFGLNYFDSGLLYRLLGWLCINYPNISIIAASKNMPFVFDKKNIIFVPEIIGLSPKNKKKLSAIDLRTEVIAKEASNLAKDEVVRSNLLELQRQKAVHPGVVADGRDMGSVVFPEANIKFYLNASVEVRANRRHQELTNLGKIVAYTEILSELKLRDKRDKNRKTSPLIIPKDAVVVDTNDLSVLQVVDYCSKKIYEELNLTF